MTTKSKSARKSGQYLDLLEELKDRALNAQLSAYRSINEEMIQLYWEIGKKIVERQSRVGRGPRTIEKLAADLSRELNGPIGFSARNLRYMRKFYLAYRDAPNLKELAGEIPWPANMAILDNVSDSSAREFYLKAARDNGWSAPALINQIKATVHKRPQLLRQLLSRVETLERAAREDKEFFRPILAPIGSLRRHLAKRSGNVSKMELLSFVLKIEQFVGKWKQPLAAINNPPVQLRPIYYGKHSAPVSSPIVYIPPKEIAELEEMVKEIRRLASELARKPAKHRRMVAEI